MSAWILPSIHFGQSSEARLQHLSGRANATSLQARSVTNQVIPLWVQTKSKRQQWDDKCLNRQAARPQSQQLPASTYLSNSKPTEPSGTCLQQLWSTPQRELQRHRSRSRTAWNGRVGATERRPFAASAQRFAATEQRRNRPLKAVFSSPTSQAAVD